MKLIFLIWIFAVCTISAFAQTHDPVFKMQDLNTPLSLAGQWLFTNTDNPEYKNSTLSNYKNWTHIKAPGGWPKPLNQKSNYKVGWYRAKIEFPEEMIGQEVVFLLDSYISKVDIYKDGELIFSRGQGYSSEPFYAIQPIPAKFKVTSSTHTLSLRIKTLLMRGVYQYPFEIRTSKPFDFKLFFTYLYTDHLKTFAGFLLLIFGVFFALLYTQTKIKIYLMASLLGLGTFPYFGFTHEVFFKAFNHNNILILHYLGILSMALFSNYFSQYLYQKPNRKLIIGFGTIQGFLALMFVSQVFYFNFDIFMILRHLCFFTSFVIASHSFIVFYKIHKNKQKVNKVKTSYIYFAYFLYLSFAFHDILLAINVIESIGLLFFGNFILATTIIWYSIQHFTHIFFYNKSLVKDLQILTNTLEDKVDERTMELKNSQLQLVDMAHKAGMAEVATSVLHNLGNATNNLGLYATKILDVTKSSPVAELAKLNSLVFDKYKDSFEVAVEQQPKLKTVPEAYGLLAKELTTDLSQLQDYSHKMEENVKKINSIISYQKNYTGHNYKEEINLYNLVDDIVMAHSSLVDKHQVKLEIDIPQNLNIHSEKNKLFHALYNIIDNAFGAVKDKSSTHNLISIKVIENSSQNVCLSVEDNGIGIDPKNLKTIFHQGFTTKKQGTGLGLHVTYNFIKEIGGDISVTSDGPDLGATVTLQLPKG